MAADRHVIPPPVRPVILILGPTAGGKTALAIELSRRLPGGGELIGADSMQVYRGLDLGTAKPTPEERAAAPHHLIDVAEPDGPGYSVDTWLRDADRAIEAIRGRRRWPIVVGGTNLYVKALLEGLDDGPAPDADLRRRLAALSPAERRARLEEVDPDAAARIHANDEKRTIRALEVHALTGRPLSQLQQTWHSGRVREDVVLIGLDWPVEAINRRINARVRAMVDAGLVEEVRALRAAGRLGPQAAEALGYKQILAALDGACTIDEAVEQIKIRTRRFAKQQRTWLRRFRAHPRATWLDAGQESPEMLVEKALIAASGPGPEGPGLPPEHKPSPESS